MKIPFHPFPSLPPGDMFVLLEGTSKDRGIMRFANCAFRPFPSYSRTLHTYPVMTRKKDGSGFLCLRFGLQGAERWRATTVGVKLELGKYLAVVASWGDRSEGRKRLIIFELISENKNQNWFLISGNTLTSVVNISQVENK